MQSRAKTVSEYLASLPADRRHALEEIRKVVRKSIHPDFEEGMQYGMLAWYLPHAKYPAGYHCDPQQPLPFASIASQKAHIGLYLFCIYCDPDEQARFVAEWKASGKRLDMGKSCVRVKKLEDVPLDVVGRAFERVTPKRFVAAYEASLEQSAAGRKALAQRKARTAKKKTTAKQAGKEPATRRAGTKKKAAAEKATRKKLAR
jgi:hypothetical protein